MKAKKAKDFVEELIDDLLGSEEESEKLSDKTTPIQLPVEASRIAEVNSPQEPTKKINQETRSSLDFGSRPSRSRSASAFEQGIRNAVGGKFAIKPSSSVAGLSSDAALIQSENLRVAQQKIFELEQEIERIRTENEQLAAAGETVRRRYDELQSENDRKTKRLSDLKDRFDGEKDILESSLKARDRDVKELKLKNEEFEMRLSTNLQKIRVRERELENRLELLKMESTALVRSKDETILDLKRQIDLMSSEIENFRSKSHELHRQVDEKQEVLRRTVKALRLALGLLEGEPDDLDINKKVK